MNNKVFLSKCATYSGDDISNSINSILSWWGIDARNLEGKRVLIKPNLLLARPPEGATTTHPAVVKAVAEAFVKAGAKVTIADSPGGTYNSDSMKKAFDVCGMTAAAQGSGAGLNEDFSSQKIAFNDRIFNIITPAVEADFVINIAKLKTHMLTYYTGAVKNMFGTVAGTHKAAMHAKYPYAETFSEMLVDLCTMRVPDLSIIDGVEGMEGNGPSGGSMRRGDIIIASENPFAADLAAIRHMGISYKKAPVHRIGARRGLVPLHPSGLELEGDDIAPLPLPFIESDGKGGLLVKLSNLSQKLGFVSKIKRHRMPYPHFSARCVGCGDCAAVCPKKAIEIIDKKAVLKNDLCIKCYCCHEMCPIKAVDLQK